MGSLGGSSGDGGAVTVEVTNFVSSLIELQVLPPPSRNPKCSVGRNDDSNNKSCIFSDRHED